MSVRLHRSARRPVLAATSCAVLTAAALIAAPATAGAARPAAQERHSSGPTVVAEGLNSPRLLSFGRDGALYVAEAGTGGTGPCTDSPTGELCFGRTGSVTRIKHGSQRRVLDHLPSVSGGEGDTLGPADVIVGKRGRYVISMGAGMDATQRAALGPAGRTLGTWVTGRLGKHRMRVLADLAAFENRANPDDSVDRDSDPTGITMTRHGVVGTDSGGNTLVRASSRRHHGHYRKARVRPLAVFGTRTAPGPDGSPIPMQAVPTSVAVGPDGALYVSQLTGFPFPANGAQIFRVVKGHEPTVWATGLTNVTDLTWSHGKLYAVQLATDGLLATPPETLPMGSLVRVHRGDNSTEDTVAGDLPAPYGVAIRHGAAYVTTCTVCAGGGGVTRIPLS